MRLLNVFRDSSGLSVSGPCYYPAGCGDSHVHHHLLRLRGIAARKHLPPPDGELGAFQTGPAFVHHASPAP